MAPAKPTIIIVDDDKSILKVFTRILQRCGYEVDNAETGKEAIERLSRRSYDVALIDVKLPDMDGPDLLLIKHDSLRRAVKILITGLDRELESSNSKVEVDAYLVKPVAPDQLLSLIAEKLRSKNKNVVLT